MNNAHFEQDLTKHLHALVKDKMPERDLWPGIELALVEPQAQQLNHKQGPKLRLLAASVLLVGLIGWLSVDQLNNSMSGAQLVASLSEQHAVQKQALLVQFKDQPALTDNWQEQLIVLDEAEAAIKTALKNDPDNMALLKLLQNVYQQQLGLIERVHAPKWSQI